MSDLRDKLMQIQGVGAARADEIIKVYEDHGTGPMDQPVQEVRENLSMAVDYAEQDDTDYAMKYVRRSIDLLSAD